MIDWTAHYDTIYQTLGVSAVLTGNNTDAVEAAITVIDKTSDAKTGQVLDVNTVRPVAAVRMAELAGFGVGLDDLDGGGIVFNGKTYSIETHQVKPAPTGESLGEVYLIMTEA
jgi:hypothetical protein